MKGSPIHTGTDLRARAEQKWIWRVGLVAVLMVSVVSVLHRAAGQTSTVTLGKGENGLGDVNRTWEARHISPKAEEAGYFGSAIEVIEDVTGDKTPELLVGAPRESPNGSAKNGRVYLLNGIGGLPIRSIRSPDPEKNGRFGSALAQVPDLNDDGRKEMLIGASGEDIGLIEGAGTVYVLHGGNGTVLGELRSPRPVPHGRFGAAVTALGAATGSGTSEGEDKSVEIAIGAPGEQVEKSQGPSRDTLQGAGRVYRFVIQRGGRGSNDIQSLKTGTIESPSPETSGHFGVSLAAEGRSQDVDGLGLTIGADESPRGVRNAGRLYFTGPDGEIMEGSLRSPAPVKHGRFGASVSHVPDVDDDGGPELLVGGPVETPIGRDRTRGGGMVYLLDGGSKEVKRRYTLPNAHRNSFFGMAIGNRIDRDGDEGRRWPHPEILVGSAAEHREKRAAGVIYRFDL